MKKEAIISFITVTIIFIGHFIIQNYSKKSISETTSELNDLKAMINQDVIDKNVVKKKINDIHHNWDKKYITMAFFIEHNELEKVETELTGLRASIETEEYNEAQNELARAEYILNHIEEKNKLSWKNIF